MPAERRRFPRMRVAFPVEVRATDNEMVSAMAIDISSDGIQLECDTLVAQRIVPDVSEVVFTQHVHVEVSCELPLSNGQSCKVAFPGKVVYIRRASQTGYHIGVNFGKVSDDSYQGLVQFFDAK